MAVETLVEVVKSGREPCVAVAIQQLAELHATPEARRAKGDIVAVLSESSRPETLLVASTALSVLAEPGDADVIDALSTLRLKSEGEVGWSAALALARLGSDSGKTTLLDLLDRGFWQSGDRYEVIDETGQVRRYPMPPERIEALIIASIAAASNLDDPEVWSAIEMLKADSSHAVRGAAMEALAGREAVDAGTA
jgi:HEAT repeat protein